MLKTLFRISLCSLWLGSAEKHGAVALDKASVAEVERAMNLKVRAGQVHINREPSVHVRLSRIGSIEAHDEILPYITTCSKRILPLKNGGDQNTQDRIGKIGTKDNSLTAMFEKSIHLPRRTGQEY